MIISDLVNKLNEILEKCGDIEIVTEINYFSCHGEENELKTGNIIEIIEGRNCVILIGDEI